MVPTLTEPLSGALHELLTARSLRERNKELVLALVAAGNRGEVNQLTRHWAGPDGTRRRAMPKRMGMTGENPLAHSDIVVLRENARAGRAAWSLVAELRFNAAGRVEQCHDVFVPTTTAS